MPEASKLLVAKSLTQLLNYEPQHLAQMAPLQGIDLPSLSDAGVRLSLLRLDLMHERLSGNKLFKLYYHLKAYRALGQAIPIASFGGAYSNHLHALAVMGDMLGFPTIGIVRGDGFDCANATLNDLQRLGMQVHFVDRMRYRGRNSDELSTSLEHTLGKVFWVPEGGGGKLGIKGCIAIGRRLRALQADTIAVATGTGSTLAGIVAGLSFGTETPMARVSPVLGFSPLKKSSQWMSESVAESLPLVGCAARPSSWQVTDEFHFGGFGTFPVELNEYLHEFEYRTRVLLDPVYTAKMMYGIERLALRGFWPKGSHIVAVHTGGLQGRRGFHLKD